MKKNIYSIISFILMVIPFMWMSWTTTIEFTGLKLNFLSLASQYTVQNLSMIVLLYSTLAVPPILFLLSVLFGIKHIKAQDSDKGYRILSILSVTISFFALFVALLIACGLI